MDAKAKQSDMDVAGRMVVEWFVKYKSVTRSLHKEGCVGHMEVGVDVAQRIAVDDHIKSCIITAHYMRMQLQFLTKMEEHSLDKSSKYSGWIYNSICTVFTQSDCAGDYSDPMYSTP